MTLFRDSVGHTLMLCPRVYPQFTHTVPRIHKLRQRPVTGVCTAKVSKGRSQSPLVAPAGAKSPCDMKNQVTQEKHTPKISIANRGYGEKSQIPLSSILPRKSAFEKPENSPNSLPSASWCIKIGLQKRIWHACSPADFIPPQSQWRCNCPLPRRSAAHLDAGERGLGGA